LIAVKKSRKIRWAGRVACLADRIFEYMVIVGKPKGHRPLEKLDIDEKIILKGNI